MGAHGGLLTGLQDGHIKQMIYIITDVISTPTYMVRIYFFSHIYLILNHYLIVVQEPGYKMYGLCAKPIKNQ